MLIIALSSAISSRAQFPGPAFVVDSTADQPDFDPGDGTCNTNPIIPSCTLRAAIQESNFHPGTDTIRFASGITTISPTTALPEILDALQIDGNNGFDRVEIDGSSMLEVADGLVVRATGSFVENLRIKGFGGNGVTLDFAATLGSNVIFLNGGAGIVTGPGAADSGLFDNTLSQNTGPGIRVVQGPVTIQAGGAVGNGGDGIEVLGGVGTDISAGGYLDNGGLAIDLDGDGVTANDAGDADTGTNDLQNFPVLTAATTTGTRPQPGQQVVVQGTIDTTEPVTLGIYGADACDPSGHGEGTFFMGEQTSVGPGPFTITLPGAGAPDGRFITATATDSGGSTSEFSNCVAAVLVGSDLGAAKTASPGAGPGEFVTTGNQVRFLATISNAGPDPATNVTLLDIMPHPSFATFDSATASQGICGTPDSNGAMTCQLGAIAAGASVTIDVRVTPTINSSINLENKIFALDADQTDPECTIEPPEPAQTDTPQCDGAVAVTHVEPAGGGETGGFVDPGETLSTGTTATASDSTVVSLTNNGTGGTSASLAELGCPGSGDPLCADPNIVGQTLADVSVGSTAAAALSAAAPAPSPSAPFTATLLYDRSVLPTTKVQAFHVYAGTTRLAACSRKVGGPCVSATKLLSGSKDLEVKVSLVGSAKLRTSTS